MVKPAPAPCARTGWWAQGELSSPLDALRGVLLRAEVKARWSAFAPVLVHQGTAGWRSPGFTGEPVCLHSGDDLGPTSPSGFDILVASGQAAGQGKKVAAALGELGTELVAVAPGPDWGLEPEAANIGPPFGVPEPTLLAARHFARPMLDSRAAYLRVVEGLPRHYVLVEGSLLGGGRRPWHGPEPLELALSKLGQRARGAGDHRPAEVVALAPQEWSADPEVAGVLRSRRAEAYQAAHLAEDWPGDPERPRLPLRVESPLDLAAAVAGAGAVVAESGALMALAWALGVPHAAIGPEGSAASDFAAWTGDASALVDGPAGLEATTDNIFARGGRPLGLKRLEATVDQALDQATANLQGTAAKLSGTDGQPPTRSALEARLAELSTANDALRQRLAIERQRFGERSLLLEQAASTTVESAIKAYRGQDVIVRRQLEEALREMRRLQDETAVQQAELRDIHGTKAWQVLMPARQAYGRLRRLGR